MDITYGGAFFAGLLSFLTPCILPMVPFYLSYMAGLSMSELRGDGKIAPGAQARMVASSVAFALGVTTIFVLMGMGATALGAAFREWMGPLSWVAAAILLVFGLHFLGVIRIPFLYREARMEAKTDPTTFLGAYVMGLAFGFGWTPCVGPALAAILMVASGMGDISKGGLLLFAYGIGMTLPFIIAAFFTRPFLAFMAKHRAKLGYVEKAMGVMLILFAVLIVTGGLRYIGEFLIDVMPSGSLG
ncbi:cytochrome C biogenesis protein CcdA [Thioclava sediminum]|uniref:Cytochrome c biogenesis protein CcdA n=2 Tax=Thioclava TaxID=285107 RepID=A0ABX6Z027_9RHOB|nr:cytochrome C biogenesis protein CcdA [Thioclava sp.]MPQ94729.1 cytochrome c biogenesis protein CcdA [Thioclava sp. JE_KL1]OOY05892.1 cytochrome C biogenesis protein CcdA [Thioclava sp. F28-4]OOY07750.1 cytochrome C biogenesis protein CcdA [Thioclava sp. F36-7]OOY18687.1 cytochrome C biogenesis protein CcdA [Thioclava sp. DLFJ5-1]OOY22843.1 cytochrome C biogenesis protein CcdA [Thioclava sediminum]OOY32217.1 cytochrome C biogenesis protein CcdA [Thioclava sp. F36-6]QPZ93243.1 cytochrome c 